MHAQINQINHLLTTCLVLHHQAVQSVTGQIPTIPKDSMSNAHDILTRNRYQILVPEPGTGFWYQLQLEAKFLVPETNIADDADKIGAVCAMAVFVRHIKQREN